MKHFYKNVWVKYVNAAKQSTKTCKLVTYPNQGLHADFVNYPQELELEEGSNYTCDIEADYEKDSCYTFTGNLIKQDKAPTKEDILANATIINSAKPWGDLRFTKEFNISIVAKERDPQTIPYNKNIGDIVTGIHSGNEYIVCDKNIEAKKIQVNYKGIKVWYDDDHFLKDFKN